MSIFSVIAPFTEIFKVSTLLMGNAPSHLLNTVLVRPSLSRHLSHYRRRLRTFYFVIEAHSLIFNFTLRSTESYYTGHMWLMTDSISLDDCLSTLYIVFCLRGPCKQASSGYR